MNINRAYGGSNTVALDNETLMKRAPSIFATEPAKKTSNKFFYVPTIEVINEMKKHNWLPTLAVQANTRIAENEGYQKHMIRFRRADQLNINPEVGDTVNELVLVNAHNGSSSYQIHGGLYRFVCKNGMVVSDNCVESVKVRHTGEVLNEIIEGTYKIMEDVPALANTIESWKNLTLSRDQQEVFGNAAIKLKWDDENSTIEYRPDLIVAPKRKADIDPSLWNTLNIVQENMIRGGTFSINKNKRGYRKLRKTQGVKSVSESVKLNKALWTLTEAMQNLI